MLFLWCTLYFSIKQRQQSVRERERLLRAESEARDARLSALRYQLNPHFLFHSLNAVSTVVLKGDGAEATRMISQISRLLRRLMVRLSRRSLYRRNWTSPENIWRSNRPGWEVDYKLPLR
jgi:LytS/YehU family sensor histidine kinase